MAKHSVTNTSDGPRVLNSNPPMVLQPRASTDEPVEISDEELVFVKASGHFDIGDSDHDTAEKPLSKMNKAELLATAEAETVTSAKDADGNDIAIADATNPQIVAAIETARAA